MRRLVALVYRARRFLRARTRGVKVMLFDEDGALLLVRHNRYVLWADKSL